MEDEHGSWAIQVRRISNGWLVSCGDTQKYCAEPHEVLAEIANGYGAHFERLSISKLSPENVAAVGYAMGENNVRSNAKDMIDLCNDFIKASTCECPAHEGARLKTDKDHVYGCIVAKAERALNIFRNTHVSYPKGETCESQILKKAMY